MNKSQNAVSINHSVLPQGQIFYSNSAFSTLPSSQPSFRIIIQFIYHNVVNHLISSSAANFLPHLPFLLEHPSAGSSFLVSGPANFFSPSLSVFSIILPSPTLSSTTEFFILSVHFTHSILLHIHISNASSRFCLFRRSIQVSAPCNATLHTKNFSILFLSSFFFKGQGSAYTHKYINKRRDQAPFGL